MCANKDEIKSNVESTVHSKSRAWMCILGNESFASQVHELGTRGVRSLAVGRKDGEDGPWRMLGILTFLDPPRPDTKQVWTSIWVDGSIWANGWMDK